MIELCARLLLVREGCSYAPVNPIIPSEKIAASVIVHAKKDHQCFSHALSPDCNNNKYKKLIRLISVIYFFKQ